MRADILGSDNVAEILELSISSQYLETPSVSLCSSADALLLP